MKFSKFQPKSTAITAVHDETGATFHIQPMGSHIAGDRMKHLPIKKMNKLQTVMQSGDMNGEVLEKHYETLADFNTDMAMFQAAHLDGWDNLEDDDGPVEFTRDNALLVLSELPMVGWWILHKAVEAHLAKTTDTEVEADAKKK